MRISLADAEGKWDELVRKAEAGDEVVLTRDGAAAVRLVAVASPPILDAEARERRRLERRSLMEAVARDGAAKALPGPSAARSQDFLYDDDGLPA